MFVFLCLGLLGGILVETTSREQAAMAGPLTPSFLWAAEVQLELVWVGKHLLAKPKLAVPFLPDFPSYGL